MCIFCRSNMPGVMEGQVWNMTRAGQVCKIKVLNKVWGTSPSYNTRKSLLDLAAVTVSMVQRQDVAVNCVLSRVSPGTQELSLCVSLPVYCISLLICFCPVWCISFMYVVCICIWCVCIYIFMFLCMFYPVCAYREGISHSWNPSP